MNEHFKRGDKVRYVGWLPSTAKAIGGRVIATSGQSVLIAEGFPKSAALPDGPLRWVDRRNIVVVES